MNLQNPIINESGSGDLITFNPENPMDAEVNDGVLAARHDFALDFARRTSWDPISVGDDNKGIIGTGMECGQYSEGLEAIVGFAKRIGCQFIQPAVSQLDLARAATDLPYRLAVREIFRKAAMPLTSVSMHVHTWSALAVLGNHRARMFVPPEILAKSSDPEVTSLHHVNYIALMIIGAAQLGVRDLHLFWGDPDNLGSYGWEPQSPQQVAEMRARFMRVAGPLINFALCLGVNLCHEIHPNTLATTAEEFIEVWEALGCPDNFCVGIDPSHFWRGEPWYLAMDKLRKAKAKVALAHVKNFVLLPGRSHSNHERDDRLAGVSFTMLDNPQGGVSVPTYLGLLTLSGLYEHWVVDRGLPMPVHVEAEDPFWDIHQVTAKGVKYVRDLASGLMLPKGHFTDAMRVA